MREPGKKLLLNDETGRLTARKPGKGLLFDNEADCLTAREPDKRLLFDDETGCLTAFGLESLVKGSLEELERLEASEHLAYCDLCVERYTALLTEETLLEAPDTMKQSVLSALRKKAAKVFVNRYFHMAVAASLTLVLWSTGVFTSFRDISLEPPRLEPDRDTVSISERLENFTDGVNNGLYGLMDQLRAIDLRGAIRHEKE